MKAISKQKILNRLETIRYLGYKTGEPDSLMLEEIELCEVEFLKVVEPKYHYEVFELKHEGDRLMLADGSFEFPGEEIKKHLSGCSKVAFSCATLSKGVDELIDRAQKDDMLMALIYDSIANACIEEVRERAEEDIKATYKFHRINWQFGIGYGDLPLSLQPIFLERIHARDEIGLTVNERNLLVPLKSVTGFVGLYEQDQNTSNVTCKQRSCLNCPNKDNCLYQKEK